MAVLLCDILQLLNVSFWSSFPSSNDILEYMYIYKMFLRK